MRRTFFDGVNWDPNQLMKLHVLLNKKFLLLKTLSIGWDMRQRTTSILIDFFSSAASGTTNHEDKESPCKQHRTKASIAFFLRCFLVFHPLFIMASRSDSVRKTKRNWNWFFFARHSHMFASTGRNVWSGLFKLIINTAHSPVGEVKWVKIASLVRCNFLCYFSLLIPFTHFSFARHAYFKRCRLCEYGIEAHENEKMTFRAPWELHWTCYDARLLLRFIFLYQSMTSW